MHANCQQSLSVSDFARMCDLSECHFIHLFREYTGEAPYAYLTRLRLEKAKDLMVSTTLTISEIAAAVGYPNPLYFSRLFKRYYGITPWEIERWRRFSCARKFFGMRIGSFAPNPCPRARFR